MTTVNQLLKGISIINSYYSQDGYNIDAEHDQIFMVATDVPICFAHLLTLWDLGWFQPNIPEHEYSIEEGWSIYL